MLVWEMWSFLCGEDETGKSGGVLVRVRSWVIAVEVNSLLFYIAWCQKEK